MDKEGLTPEATNQRTKLEGLIGRMNKIEYVCNKKREVLLEVGLRRAKREKLYHTAAGALAIFSGGSVSAALSNHVSSTFFSIIGAALAFLSGLVSLITTHFFDEKVTQRIFEGAASYAGLRANAQLESVRPNLTEKQAFESLKDLLIKYNDIIRYDVYIPLAVTKNWPSSEVALELPVPGTGDYFPIDPRIISGK
jgi:hypothetical protein